MKYLLFVLLLVVVLITAGCVSQPQTPTTTTSYSVVVPLTIEPLTYQATTRYLPESSEYGCFEITGLSEAYIASGYLGPNIADTRRMTGTIKNNCGKIMAFHIRVRWFDENGEGAYVSSYFSRLKSGESKSFVMDGFHNTKYYGYLEETKGWTYKIAIEVET